MNKLVSIIVPLYNKELYVQRCILSLLKQKYQLFEIIIINDGSTDNSEKIVKEIYDSRIKVYSIKNSGVSVARNYGLNIAKGEFIVFVDPDDYVSPFYLSSMIEVMDVNIDLVVSGKIDVNNDKKIKCVLQKFEGEVKDVPSNFFVDGFCHPVWGKLFRRKIIENNYIQFKNINISEDSFFNISYLRKCNNIKFIDSCDYYYVHYGENNLTSYGKFEYIEIYNELYLEYKNFFENNINDYSDLIIYPQYYNLLFKIIKNESLYNIKNNVFIEKVYKDNLISIFNQANCKRTEKIINFLMRKKMWFLLKVLIKILYY